MDGIKRFFMRIYQENGPLIVSELITGMGDLNGHVGRNIDGFKAVHGGLGIGERNQEGRMLLEYSDAMH